MHRLAPRQRPLAAVLPGRGPWRRRSGHAAPPRACLRCAVVHSVRPSPLTTPPPTPTATTAAPLLLLLLARRGGPATTTAAAAQGDEQQGGGGGGGGGGGPPAFGDDDEDGAPSAPPKQGDDVGLDDPSLDPLARVALLLLRFYRQGVSPLLQPACRYQPTCSRYAIEAYRRHGGWRGTVLTAWRLARCAPWGKGGYDPVRWPPVGLEAVFGRYDAAAPVAVVLGTAGFVKLVHALLFE
jgi:uncharacterized protein